jgi:hypothetical protein
VLDLLRQHELWANAPKCEFFTQQVDYLGYLVTPDGIKMDPSKVSAILDWPAPTSITGVRSFLGFANFYRRFIRDYSAISHAITSLLKKDVPFHWDKAQELAFAKLKTAFTTAPVLVHFQPSLPLVLEVDASDYAIGGVISHPDPATGALHPIAFFSRKMHPAELNYDIYNKEMLACIEALRLWRPYLDGCDDITIRTDHKNLEYWKTARILNRRHMRWHQDLQDVRPKIVYVPGRSMSKADALSRRQGLQEGTKASDAAPIALLSPDQFLSTPILPSSLSSTKILSDLKSSVSPPLSVSPPPSTPDKILSHLKSWSSPAYLAPIEQDGTPEPQDDQPDEPLTSGVLERIRTAQPADPLLADLLPFLVDPALPRPDNLAPDLELL